VTHQPDEGGGAGSSEAGFSRSGALVASDWGEIRNFGTRRTGFGRSVRGSSGSTCSFALDASEIGGADDVDGDVQGADGIVARAWGGVSFCHRTMMTTEAAAMPTIPVSSLDTDTSWLANLQIRKLTAESPGRAFFAGFLLHMRRGTIGRCQPGLDGNHIQVILGG
jgi:hypothetical protein